MSAVPISLSGRRKGETTQAVPRSQAPSGNVAVPALRTPPWIETLRERGAALLPYLDYAVQHLGAVGIIGVALLIFSAGFVFSATSALRTEQSSLRAEVQLYETPLSRGRRVAPAPGAQLDAFLHSLPRQSDLPRVVERLFEEARAAGVELESGTYELVPGRSGHLARYRINYPVTASYPALRRFVDAVLLTMPAVGLENLSLERPNIADQQVDADLHFVVVLRDER